MSAVSFPPPSPSPEPPAPRRRAQAGDGGREPASFSLPEERAAEAKPARAADRAEARATESGAPQNPEQARDGAAAKVRPAPAGPAGAPGQENLQAAPGQVAATVDAQPKADVAVLVAIAEAGQVAGEIGEAAGKPKRQDGEVAATADGDEATVMPVPLPDLAIVPQAQPAPELQLATDASSPIPTGEAALNVAAEAIIAAVPGVAGEGAAPDGSAGAAGIAGIMAASTPAAATGGAAGEALAQPAADPVPTAGTKPQQAVAANPSFDPAAAGGVDPDAAGGQADAAGKLGEIAAPSHGKVTKEASAEAQSSAAPAIPGDTAKPAEAPQPQPLPAGIDLSALVHARVAKPEPLAAAGLDQSAAANAQQPLTGSQQDPTGGQPTPLHVVPLEIGLRALAGSKRFDIRLDPAELGRIDVKLDISDKGEVSAKLVVDRVETLHLLQRDARTLERAFEQAGLKPSDAGVDITLRDQGDQSGFRQNQQQDEQAPRRARTGLEAEADEVAVIAQPVPVRRLVRLGGVDLSI